MKPLTSRVLALTLGLGAGLILVEGSIRVLRLDRPALTLVLVGSSSPTSAYHPRLGWVNLPDSTGFLRLPAINRALATNHQGFRFPRDFTREKRRRYRVAVVGDSQVFGFVVGEDEHLAVLLDRMMEDVEVYPFGVPGYGPTQEMLLLEETVFDYRPDVVVAVLFLENDLSDETEGLGYGFLAKPFLQQAEGEWKVANMPVPLPLSPSPHGARMFLRAREGPFSLSALYRLAVYRSVQAPALAAAIAWLGLGSLETVPVRDGPNLPPDTGFRRADGTEPACNVVSLCPEEHWLDGLSAAVVAYERMEHLCEVRGIRFLALVSPAVEEFKRKAFPITAAATSALQENGIEVVSLEEPFTRSADPMRLLGPDRHWTAEGTRVVAAVVRQRVLALLGLDAAAAGPGKE